MCWVSDDVGLGHHAHQEDLSAGPAIYPPFGLWILVPVTRWWAQPSQSLGFPFHAALLIDLESLLCISESLSHRFLPISFKLIDLLVWYPETEILTPSPNFR